MAMRFRALPSLPLMYPDIVREAGLSWLHWGKVAVVAGGPGTGKAGVARALFEQALARGSSAVWLNARGTTHSGAIQSHGRAFWWVESPKASDLSFVEALMRSRVFDFIVIDGLDALYRPYCCPSTGVAFHPSAVVGGVVELSRQAASHGSIVLMTHHLWQGAGASWMPGLNSMSTKAVQIVELEGHPRQNVGKLPAASQVDAFASGQRYTDSGVPADILWDVIRENE